MKIKIKKVNDFFSISILLLIIGFCALRKITFFMYFAEMVFLFCCIDRIKKRGRMIIDNYMKLSIIFLLFAGLSYIWSISTENTISALLPLFQISIIGILLDDYLDDLEKINFVWKALIVSSIIMTVFLLFTTPYVDWINAMKASSNASTAANRIGRSIGFQPNGLGIICAFTIIIWIYVYSIGKANKKLTFIMITLLTIVILFTKSRKALIILVLGPILYLILYKARKSKLLLILPVAGVAIVIMTWLFLNVSFLYDMIGFRLVGFFSVFNHSINADASILARNNMVKTGLDLFKQYPVAGVGFGNFSYYYFHNYGGWAEVYAHNNYIEILSDTGLIGFVLYYYIPFSILFNLIKNWKRFVIIDRKLTALLITFIIIRLIMDYGMVDYDDEFVQICTVTCYCGIKYLKRKVIFDAKKGE
ncbi:MAG: O-antigen ligase family protein [Anaerostipes sp.]|jgi:O-antigen ligase|nr:O-antigen ligase family protein [Anaerostipes sp.]